MSLIGVCGRLRMMCLESSPAVPKSISFSGRKHPDNMSSRGDSGGEFGVTILTRFVDGVLFGGVGAVGGVDDDDAGMMLMRGGLGLPSPSCLLRVVMPSVFRTTF